jgi:putative methyltransferase (TIGR04325 family)
MLDWGGGIGHYYLYAQALMSDIEIDYTCKDVPLLAEAGQKNFPEALFTADEAIALNRKYDLILASGSMHYSEDWRGQFARLAKSTEGYLYITRLPTIHNEPSYVMVQRPYAYGFNTEYLGWCINRTELLETAKAENMELVREFIIENPPHIYHAPEQCDYWGYLFRPMKQDV